MSSDDSKKDSVAPVGDKEIQLYSLATPNGVKIALFLEEAGVPYDAHTVPISGPNAAQFKPWFVGKNPNSKIPVITDLKGPDGKPFNVCESGAILIYLAEKYGKFLPTDPAGRSTTLQWLMFQMGGVGPMTGQASHFFFYAPEDVPYAKTRYKNEVQRLLKVVDTRLGVTGAFIAGSEYTIADMAIFPWLSNFDRLEKVGLDLNLPHLRRWVAEIEKRPATARAKIVTPFQ